MARVVLKKGREASLHRRHPWVFSGAIERLEGAAQAGETVEVLSAEGTFLARGAYSPTSQIAVRVWTFAPEEQVDMAFFRTRLTRAIAAREQLVQAGSTNAYRLVNAESDGLPGLIVDHYAGYHVCQFLSAGAEAWRETIVTSLSEAAPCRGIYERSDIDVRAKEDLSARTGLLWGEEPPELIEIFEGNCRFLVDVRRGHKTGFYLDQRENRALVASFSRDKEVLNCFAYTGAFGVCAMRAGATSVTNIESSAEALALAEQNMALNDITPSKIQSLHADVFQELRRMRDRGRQFDMVILDPPKFAESQAQIPRASRGYKDINLLAFKLLRDQGLLFTFSCSGLMTPELFQKIVADAALDAGRWVHIIGRLGQAADHPVATNFPEGHYLKGFVCRVVG
ncbi:MAG: class I SAM-dependent methyltransferase [candidate division KSB1 bacterium]|nr:class I SAM-dependent methyltransferase [candidate division KSB1 bacterium]MDZ7386106.1 class I SAM-dependent methyltransferase [candidate division KSB1 bacterium]MDZ7393000.1 class I SAM-dependent methyltransferase [candidate division KSB1 bacterium]